MRFRHICIIILLATFVSCQKDNIVLPPEPEEKPEDTGEYKGLIPQATDGLARLYINTPQEQELPRWEKETWVELCDIKIDVTVNGEEKTVYEADSLRIRGRGNSTWGFPKQSYRFNLTEKVNFIGSGQTKKWVLMANWMDRTLLRNDVALEAARRTCIEWVPSGTFVDFYVNGSYRGVYWLGEKINIEKGNFLCDYLIEYGSDNSGDFRSHEGVWNKGQTIGNIPVELKYPDLDDVEDPNATIQAAANSVYMIEQQIYSGSWISAIEVNSMVDWLLVNELCMNAEPKHPKSSYFQIKNGVMHAGPSWDFDWGTFSSNPFYADRMSSTINFGTIYYGYLTAQPAFRQRIKERWTTLKHKFESLDQYIDKRADFIRESEAKNHEKWPCYPNPFGKKEGIDGYINFDEQMTFQEAVDAMKSALKMRISTLDKIINAL